MGEKYVPHIKLSVRRDGTGFFGPGIAELLELVDQEGSLKVACARMGLSYSKGRYILRRAEQCLEFPLIEIRHGGQGGGASVLTEEGRRCLTGYREIEREVTAYAAGLFESRWRTNE